MNRTTEFLECLRCRVPGDKSVTSGSLLRRPKGGLDVKSDFMKDSCSIVTRVWTYGQAQFLMESWDTKQASQIQLLKTKLRETREIYLSRTPGQALKENEKDLVESQLHTWMKGLVQRIGILRQSSGIYMTSR